MTRVTVSSDGRITIPRTMREQAGLAEGTCLEVEVTPRGVLLRWPVPAGHDPGQSWFWAEEWQDGERAIDEAMGRGERGRIFSSDEEFGAHLRAIDEELRAGGR